MPSDEQFATFVRQYYDGLFRTAYLLTGDRAAGEDLLQETLTRLYPKWSMVTGARSPLGYVRRSLTNDFISSRRRRSARDLVMSNVPERASATDAYDALVDRGFALTLLGVLPEKQQAAIVLRFLDDLTDEQIAADLGCRPATVRSLISRGLATMHARAKRSREESDTIVQEGRS